MTPLPESANRPDWFRLAAQRVNSLLNRVGVLETHSVASVTFQPTTAPASPVAGMTYFDSGTNKLRTYDGTGWNDHW